MDNTVPEGTRRIIDGRERVFYSDYWVKTYTVPEDTLQAKRKLIGALTRRLFNHVEHGLNIPGSRLNEARKSYEDEADPERRRVKGAMLAGALFNRAADIFTKLVELQSVGIEIQSDNALMRECGRCLQEALGHRGGVEMGAQALAGRHEAGPDVEDVGVGAQGLGFCLGGAGEGLHVGAEAGEAGQRPEVGGDGSGDAVDVAQGEGDLDVAALVEVFEGDREGLEGLAPQLVDALLAGAVQHQPAEAEGLEDQHLVADGRQLLQRGRDLISDITRARTPMPKSAQEYIERCEAYAARCARAETRA